jgi:hypothetical protein
LRVGNLVLFGSHGIVVAVLLPVKKSFTWVRRWLATLFWLAIMVDQLGKDDTELRLKRNKKVITLSPTILCYDVREILVRYRWVTGLPAFWSPHYNCRENAGLRS